MQKLLRSMKQPRASDGHHQFGIYTPLQGLNMKKYFPVFASLLLLLCLASATFLASAKFRVASKGPSKPLAQEAKLVLVAPTSVRIGELAHLDVSESTAVEFRWLLVPDSVDFLVFDSGSRAVFSGREAGEYQIIIGCAVAGTLDVISHTIRVIGPPEVSTQGTFDELIPYWMWNNPLPSEECAALADSFESIAARIEELSTPTAWIEATSQANRIVLGDRIDIWSDILEKIGNELLRKAQVGELTTPEEHRKVWLEIAEGFRAC
jgi:hypothetical protein